MYIICVMIFTFSIREFEHPKFLKSQFGHPVMEVSVLTLFRAGFLKVRQVRLQVKGFVAVHRPERSFLHIVRKSTSRLLNFTCGIHLKLAAHAIRTQKLHLK